MLISILSTFCVEKRRILDVALLESGRRGEAEDFTAYVRKEGRITLPKEVRDSLAIAEGCLVRCRVEKVKDRK